jgi:hypothetical protein
LGIVAAVDGRAGTDFRSIEFPDQTAVFLDRPVSTYSFLFGPEVNVFRYGRVSVNLRALAGFIHSNNSNANAAIIDNAAQTFLVLQGSNTNTFSMATGGSLDVRLARGFSWRAFQPEMQLTRINGRNEPNFRVATGLVYSFGKR